MQLRITGRVLLAPSSALCFPTSLLKPQVKSLLQAPPTVLGVTGAAVSGVPCTGPDCKPPKLQLGKISPGTLFVHYTPIFIANFVLKYRLSNRFTILFYFILFCFPECNFYLLFNQVLSLAGRMWATFMYRKIIVAQRRNKTIRSSWGINSNPH